MSETPQKPRAWRYFCDPDFGTARLLWCTMLGVVTTLLVPHRFPWRVRALAGWDVGVTLLLVMDWRRILRADARTTARRAGSEDVGRFLVWVLVVAACLFSLVAALNVLKQVRGFAPVEREVWSALAVVGVALAWTLTHTAYTLRYAHLHYGSTHLGGFAFHGDQPPTELDFAYLAFTVGMTFATSDVDTTSRTTRRAVLGHALVSFVYNMTILALAIQLALTWLAS